MGFKVGNDIFAKNSWYFRNALVRANYKNVRKGIQQEPEHLEKFFRNLLMGEHNELRNRYLHVDYKGVKDKAVIEKSKNVTVKCHSKNQRTPETDSRHCERESEKWRKMLKTSIKVDKVQENYC
ncbi:hypothetical protein SAMN05720762_102159 [Fibrobacter sp. UWH4]|nr:hypothetical protein [Fibrobacter sp. UWH4]SHK55318.1 hypothetical protein SAMN05720762_102159 [Fibrobacter sp. UWH4]